MSEQMYIDVTKENHATCHAHMHDAFLSQSDFSKQIGKVVDAFCRAKGILFLDKMIILTETLSPLAIESILKKCKRMGLRATAENETMKGKYLYSDGWGHYSTDYYQIFRYGLVTIVG